MGCEQSTPLDAGWSQGDPPRKKGIGATERLLSTQIKKAGLDLPPDPKVNDSGHLIKEEIVKRTENSVTHTEIMLGNYQKGSVVGVSYAYWTQRGYYPDGKTKRKRFASSKIIQGLTPGSLFRIFFFSVSTQTRTRRTRMNKALQLTLQEKKATLSLPSTTDTAHWANLQPRLLKRSSPTW